VGLARRTHVAALAALALVLPFADSASAAPQWSAPATIAEGGVPQNGLHIDARGDVLAFWHRHEGGGRWSTSYAWKFARGRWTAERQLGSPQLAASFDVALGPHGRAVVLWAEEGKVLAAEAELGGEFDRGQIIGQSDTCCDTTIDVAIDDEGNALAAWAGEQSLQTEPGGTSGRSIYAAKRTADGQWSEPELVRHGTTAAGPDLAMNSAGAAVIGWTETLDMDPHISYRPPGGAFGPAERVPSEHAGIPIVAMGEAGEAVVATASRNHVIADPWRAVLAVRRALGGWEEPVSFAVNNAPDHLVVAADGTATMFMNDATDRENPQAQYVMRTAAGAVHGPVTLSADRVWHGIATNLRGDILGVLGTTSSLDPLELVERRSGKVAFAPAGPAPGASPPAVVALNDAGQAAMTWSTGRSPEHARVAVRDDLAVPLPPSPPTVTIDPPATPQLDDQGTLRLAARCSTSCQALPKGVLAAGGNRQLVPGDGPARRIPAKRRAVLKIRFGSRQSRAVRKAIRAGRKPWVSVSVRARGKSPRPITISRRIRLR
jgi:hypothetical protein